MRSVVGITLILVTVVTAVVVFIGAGTATPASATATGVTDSTVAPDFIATAACGSSLNESMDILREFRDTILLSNPPGRFIAGAYTTTSPPIAIALSENARLCTVARVLLVTPMVYFAAICLDTTAAVSFTILIAIILIVLRRHLKVFLKGIGYGALTITAFMVAVFTLGAIGYELPLCAVVAAHLLPLIIPVSVAVCITTWLTPILQSRPKKGPYHF